LSRQWIVPLFFGSFLALGLAVHDDFGIGWDEPMHRNHGRRMYEYVVHGEPRAVQHHMRYHGPIVDTTLYFLEKRLGLEDPYDIYRMRHLAYFLIFFAGVYCFYRLGERTWGWGIGLVGALLLAASPRIFADSFYNPKDVPCLSLFVVSFYTMVRYLDERSAARAAWHALATAVLIATRTIGILVPLLTGAGVLLEVTSRRKDASLRRTAGTLGLYFALAAVLCVLFWPTLWRDPLAHAVKAFQSMARYEGWPGNVLYFGDDVPAGELPWHYVPVWIAITTPLAVLGASAVGSAALVRDVVRSPLALPKERVFLLLVTAWLVVPLASIIAFDSVVYDGWRHAFFVYPALLLIALFGLSKALHAPRWRPWVVALLAIDVAGTVGSMALHHPHQNAYFNPLVELAGGAENRFDIDYWGVSYRAGLEHVLEEKPEGAVRVAVANSPGIYNSNLLPAEERERLIFVEAPSEAEFFLTNFRFTREVPFRGEEVKTIRVGGNRVLGVYRAAGR
jgi:4-amino-4-deoxy-L-arabinose transferase-like glycosyltransferase